MTVNQKPSRGVGTTGMRLGAHWQLVSWALLDKSLPLLFGLAFFLLVVRTLPQEEFGLWILANAVLLTLSQLAKATLLVPLTKFVAEGREAERVASTGLVLYVAANAGMAVVLWAGRVLWAGLFAKPALAAVLAPAAAMLLLGSARDACGATLEGLRRLRAVFFLDLVFYALTILGLAVWRGSTAPESAAAVSWVQAAAAGLGTLVSLVAARGVLAGRPGRAEAARIARFGRYSFGAGAAASLGQQADQLLAGALMDARGVAAYGAAKQCFRAFNVLSQAISQVTMPAVSRLQAADRLEDLRVLFEKAVCFLYLGLIPISAGLILGAPALFDLLLRGRYADSVPVFQMLVLGGLTLPLASVGSPFMIGLGRVRSLMWISWAGLALTLGLEVALVPRYGATGAALAVLVGAVGGMVARTWVLQGLLGFRLQGIAARSRDAVAFLRRRLGRLEPPGTRG